MNKKIQAVVFYTVLGVVSIGAIAVISSKTATTITTLSLMSGSGQASQLAAAAGAGSSSGLVTFTGGRTTCSFRLRLDPITSINASYPCSVASQITTVLNSLISKYNNQIDYGTETVNLAGVWADIVKSNGGDVGTGCLKYPSQFGKFLESIKLGVVERNLLYTAIDKTPGMSSSPRKTGLFCGTHLLSLVKDNIWLTGTTNAFGLLSTRTLTPEKDSLVATVNVDDPSAGTKPLSIQFLVLSADAGYRYIPLSSVINNPKLPASYTLDNKTLLGAIKNATVATIKAQLVYPVFNTSRNGLNYFTPGANGKADASTQTIEVKFDNVTITHSKSPVTAALSTNQPKNACAANNVNTGTKLVITAPITGTVSYNGFLTINGTKITDYKGAAPVTNGELQIPITVMESSITGAARFNGKDFKPGPTTWKATVNLLDAHGKVTGPLTAQITRDVITVQTPAAKCDGGLKPIGSANLYTRPSDTPVTKQQLAQNYAYCDITQQMKDLCAALGISAPSSGNDGGSGGDSQGDDDNGSGGDTSGDASGNNNPPPDNNPPPPPPKPKAITVGYMILTNSSLKGQESCPRKLPVVYTDSSSIDQKQYFSSANVPGKCSFDQLQILSSISSIPSSYAVDIYPGGDYYSTPKTYSVGSVNPAYGDYASIVSKTGGSPASGNSAPRDIPCGSGYYPYVCSSGAHVCSPNSPNVPYAATLACLGN